MKKTLSHSRFVAALCTGALTTALFLPSSAAIAADGDMDISKFRAPKNIRLSDFTDGVELKVSVKAKGSGAAVVTYPALVVGRSIPGNNRICDKQTMVEDAPGGSSTKNSILITANNCNAALAKAGGIRWQIVVNDENPDTDSATTISRIKR